MNIISKDKEKRKRAFWTGTSIAAVGFLTGTFAETILGTVTTTESIVSRLGFTSLGYAVGDDYFEAEEKAQEKYLSKGKNSSFGKKEAFKAALRFGFTTSVATTIYSAFSIFSGEGQSFGEALSNGAILGGQGVAVVPLVERARSTMLMLQDYEIPGKKTYDWIKNSSEKAKKATTYAIMGTSIAGMLTMYAAKNKIYPEQRGIEYFMDKTKQDTQYESIDDYIDD